MIIDAHQHVWNLAKADYPWLTSELAPIDRTVELDEVLPTMRRVGVGATVLVQAVDSSEDTANMIRVADQHAEVVGIVAWVPLDEPQRAHDLLASLRGDDRIVGVRTLLHAMPDAEWVLRDDVDAGLAVLEAAGVTFDYVTGDPAALALVPTVSSRHPQLPIVIDHLGKPPIGGTAEQRMHWRTLLSNAAQNPLVTAKLSGLYSSVGNMAGWTPESVRPFIDDAFEILGAERLMVGGDWPISVLAGGYERTFTFLEQVAAELAPHEREAILSGTAIATYSLAPGRLAAAAGGLLD